MNPTLPRIPLFAIASLAFLLPRAARCEDAQQHLLAIAPFDSLPKVIDQNYTTAALNNQLSRAASRSIVFQGLTGLDYLKGAITLDPEIGSRVYQDKHAEYLLLNCAISVNPDESYTASAVLVTVEPDGADLQMYEVANIFAEAPALDQLISRFWAAVDRPVELLYGVPDVSGRWKAEKAGSDEFITGKSLGNGYFQADPQGPEWILKIPRIIISQKGQTIEAFHDVVGGWVTVGQEVTMPGLKARWNPSGFFEGHYTHDHANTFVRQPVTARIRLGASGGKYLELTSQTVSGHGKTFPGETDRWHFEPISIEDRNGYWRAGYRAGSDVSSASFDIEVQQAGERLTVTPLGESSPPWSRIEGFIHGHKLHLYYFQQSQLKNKPVYVEKLYRKEIGHFSTNEYSKTISIGDEEWRFQMHTR